MKKILIMIFMLTLSGFAIDIKITDNVFDDGQFVDFCLHNNEIYILTMELPNKKDPVIHHFSNNQWEKIHFPQDSAPPIIEMNSQIKTDRNGDLWVSGYRYIYKYYNGLWKRYFIDDDYKENRFFSQFIFDNNNNLWIMSTVSNKNEYAFSEFLKFNGVIFEQIFKFETGFSFTRRYGTAKAATLEYTDDDKIIFQRNFSEDEEKLTTDSSYDDIYIVNEDHTYKRIKTENAILNETDIWDDMNQNISHIYSSRSNEIWMLFSERMFSYPDYPDILGNIGGGLSLYKNGEWVLCDSTNNLSRLNNYNYDAMGRMLDLKNGKYLLLGRGNCYLLDYNSTHLEKLEWSDLLMNGEIIKFNHNLTDEAILSDLIKMTEKDNQFMTISETILHNNNLYILFGRGLLILPLNNFTNVDSFADDEISIYPNPASEYIYVNADKNNINSEVEIFNAIGVKVLSTEVDKSDVINIRDLPSGFYYVKINNNIKKLIINR